MRNLDDLDRLYARISADGRKLDIVVANVGAVDSMKLADVTIESFNNNFEVNARGALFTVQKSLPLLNNGASVILTSTIASLRGFPGRSAYAAPKTALRSYARTWTMELKDRGIRVNTITPGPCDTPLIDAQVSSPEEAAAVRTKAAASTPLGRMARPEEIAGAMLFLASEDSTLSPAANCWSTAACVPSDSDQKSHAVRSNRPAHCSPDKAGCFHLVRGDFNAKAQRKSCRHHWW